MRGSAPERHPRRVPGVHRGEDAATADIATNLASLDRIAETGAQVVLPGHGEPFRAARPRPSARRALSGAA